MPNPDESGVLSSLNELWSLSRPVMKAGTRAVRASDVSSEIPMPSFLAHDDFEVVDRAELRSAPERRRNDNGMAVALQLKADVEDDDVLLLMARQESGAISFHLPQRTAIRRGSGTAKRVTVIFEVAVSETADGRERRGWIARTVRVVLVRVVKAAVGRLLEHAAEQAVPLLARKLEEQLWASRIQGWLRITAEGLAAGEDRLAAARPAFRSGERGLLLIHGTFSTAHGAFRNLARNGFLAEARALYGGNLFAFNHFTISKTPEENVRDLLDELPDQELEFDVITHSRGGLVLRELLEGSGRRHAHRRRLRIRHVVLVACPNGGTPLADPSHWDRKLSFIANLLEMFPENPFTTGAAWLTESLKWFAANVLGNCPGLSVMDPQGGYLHELQQAPDLPADVSYHAVASNFHPPKEWWARLADMGVDQFFGGANDLVVPTEGGWKTSDVVSEWIPGNRIACLGAGGNLRQEQPSSVHHSGFFSDADVSAWILSCLRGAASKLPAMTTSDTLPLRTARSVRSGVSAESVVVPTGAVRERPLSEDAECDLLTSTAVPSGWNEEQELWLTVISNHLHTKVEDEESGPAVPMLLAQYGSARVTVPFYTSGTKDNAGKRWQTLIRMHRQIVSYANGGSFAGSATADGRQESFPDSQFLQQFGDELFRTLFPEEVRNLYNVARFLHKKRRLKIIFSSMIPWVADMPWELAYDRVAGCFLTCGDVRFVRNVLTPTPSNKIQEKNGALRILVVSAQPSGAGRLSIEDERRGIYESFRPLIDAELVQVEVLAGASPSLLQERLRYQLDGDDFDVLHFIGHGEFDEQNRTGYLLFQDDVGRPKRLSAASFLNIVRGRDIRIVFLNACETGRGRQADYNRGVAMALVQDGIPAVVANQYSVIDRSASLFSLHFYACLAMGLKIGDATREARIALQYCGVEPMDWAVPVLFASNPDARLCTANCRPRGVSATAEDAFGILSRSAATLRGATGVRRKTIAVWDAENSLVYRENLQRTLDELNEVQSAFAFQLERFTAPRGLWAVDSDSSSDGVAYLRAEKVIGRMERITESIGADYLFCVTELPLRDESTTALYYYDVGRIFILSTWALDPPLEGLKLKKAMANHLAMSLLDDLCGGLPCGERDDDPEHPVHTTGFWNDDRIVAHIAGQMTITPANRKQIRQAIKKKKITQQQFDSIEVLLNLYRSDGQ